MNLLKVYLVFLIFNIVAGIFTHANIFGTPSDIAYEPAYSDIATNPQITNISTYPTQESEQYVKTWDAFGVLYDSLTINWIKMYVPYQFQENAVINLFINGINAVLLVVGIATFWQIVRRIAFL